MNYLPRYLEMVERHPILRWEGRVVDVRGGVVESEGPLCSIGESCEIRIRSGAVLPAEVIGFRDTRTLSMPLATVTGIRYGDCVVSTGKKPTIAVSDNLLGRVIDPLGFSIDSDEKLQAETFRSVSGVAPTPFERSMIRQPLACGVRAIDALLTCGRGQRMGIFGGSGVGKSTLLGMMARGTSADLTVVALVGERGREVQEFLEDALGEEGRRRSIVVVSTSDQSPLLRIRAALSATAIAEHFCGQGKNVLLVLDSITRVAMAQREIGLAAGEPPTSKGYTPSVFSLLAQLVERVGNMKSGSITAFYTVLMEGDDLMDPIVDSVRSYLDGHILLDRRMTSEGHYPPINIIESLSRLMPAVCDPDHLEKAKTLRNLLAAYSRSEDLVRIGAYSKGADPTLDRALAVIPEILTFLRQGAHEKPTFEESLQGLMRIPC